MDFNEEITPQTLAEWPPEQLAAMADSIEQRKADLKREEELLGAALDWKYGPRADQKRAEEGKDTGTVRLIDNGHEVIVNLPKRVRWDQEKIRAALDRMEPEEAKHYAKVEIKVDERKFAAAPPSIQKILMAARTVEIGKPSYKLEPVRAEEAA